MHRDHVNSEQEFLDLVDSHQGILKKICFIYSGNSLEKEDLCQEIILQLWKSYPLFKNQSAFSTWMYRVALNTALSLTRKSPFIMRREEIPDRSYDIEHTMTESENLRVLYKAINQLNNVEKAIILLWLEDNTYEEIAEVIGMSVKNISVRILRIKAKLRELIRKYE